MTYLASLPAAAEPVPGDPDVAAAARLIGEPARATMLEALLAGKALAAGELARLAGVSPATASEHLARLRDGGLVSTVATGRHRYYRLANPEVAQVLEALALVSPARPVRTLRQSRAILAMSEARTCYDHLAGRVGVGIHDALTACGALRIGPDGYELTAAGELYLAGLGVDVAAARARRRGFARPCLDVTERRPHLAGALGAAICGQLLADGWLVHRAAGQRGLRVTDTGRSRLASAFGVTTD
jgi:DNA-binding transcriptional ArsR family regulator